MEKLPGGFVLAIGSVNVIVVCLEVNWDHELLVDLDYSEGGVLLRVSCQRADDEVYSYILGLGSVTVG